MVSAPPSSPSEMSPRGRKITRKAPTPFTGRHSQAEGAGVAVGENAHELVVEVIRRFADILRNALVIHLPASVDVFLQTLVKIFVLAPLLDFSFVVQFDFRHEQPRESPPFVVLFSRFARRRTSRPSRVARRHMLRHR